MTPTDSRCLRRLVYNEPASLDFALPPGTSSRKQSHQSGCREVFKSVTTVMEPESEKRVASQRLRSSRDAWTRCPTGVSTGLARSRLLARWREPRQSQIEDSVPERRPVGYGMRRYLTGVAVPTVFRRSRRLPLAVCGEISESHRSALGSLLLSAFISRKHRSNVFFTVDEVEFLRKLAWVGESYQCARERGAKSEKEGYFWAMPVSVYQVGSGAAFLAKRAFEVLQRG